MSEFNPTGMGKEHADALILFRKVWRIRRSGVMQCKFCYRVLPATADGHLIEHKPGCRAATEQHPWAQLRAILNARQA